MRLLRNIDWLLLGAAFLISAAGIVSMESFSSVSPFADRQMLWVGLGLVSFFIFSSLDLRILRRTSAVVVIYAGAAFLLTLLFFVGAVFSGAQGWFNLGAFAVQPADPAKLALILLLAKYFSRRHIEIAHVRHLIVSGGYAFLIIALLFFQPDFGSAVIVAGLWMGMVLVAGIPFRQLALLAGVGAASVLLLWNFGFADYQKDRILTFLHPLADIQGTGYNAFQSTVAVGSGGLFGKGIGYGTQSRLQFLPQHETDFIFASFAEEWGFLGVIILLSLFGVVIYRLVAIARQGETNFESLFVLGVAVLIIVHATVHIGTNIGLLPVTGTTLPFMSYGGSHILVGYTMLGMATAMRRYGRSVRGTADKELVGVV
ncbi:MAG: FtsW/RodA/SpoVE family cell cycle protein [Patescibacteria group bacterium]